MLTKELFDSYKIDFFLNDECKIDFSSYECKNDFF